MSAATDFSHLPEVEFVERDTEKVVASVITIYEGLTKQVLYPGDPVRLFLYTLAARIAQQNVIIDDTGKQNLLRYARGGFLDHIGAMLDVTRLKASPAVTVERFSIAEAVDYAVLIPQGTRVTADASLFFATTETSLIPAGQTFVDVPVQCLASGAAGNGFVAGQINRLVDPLAVVVTVANVETTAGGADVEGDDALRHRIHLAPEKFTVAGSELAYVYWALSAHPGIADVTATSPLPGDVKLYVVLTGGIIPDPTGPEITAVLEATSGKKVRPLTDRVAVLPAEAYPLDYQFDYYVTSLQAGYAAAIDVKVREAAAAYEAWQHGRIGRDIVPDELIRLCRAAGAKRIVPVRVLERDETGVAVATEPLAFTPLTGSQIARIPAGVDRVRFAGLEDE